MIKKWSDRTDEEKKEWMKSHPKIMTAVKTLVYTSIGVTVLMIISIACCETPVDTTQKKTVVYDSLTYDQKDSILRVWSQPYDFDAKRLAKSQVLDADADVEPPNRIFIVDVDERWCRFIGAGTAKNGFGVKMNFKYSVDYYIYQDSIVWRNVEILQ